jgi:ABC-type sugar transport system substrate-binding protein
MGKIVTRTALSVLKGEPVKKFIPVPVVLVDESNHADYAK